MPVDYNLIALAAMMVGTMGFLAFTVIYSLYYIIGRAKLRIIFVEKSGPVHFYKKKPDGDGMIEIKRNTYFIEPKHSHPKEHGILRGTRWVIIQEGNPVPLVYDETWKPDPAVTPALLWAVVHNKKVREFNQSFGIDMMKVLLAFSIMVNLIMGFMAFGGQG